MWKPRNAFWPLVGEGARWGILAGLAFAVVEVVTTVAMRQSPGVPLRLAASLLLGRGVLEVYAPPITLGIGIAVHLALSALFGVVYVALLEAVPAERRAGSGFQAAFGLGFGLALWFVNFQVIARAFCPWFLGTPQLPQAVIHAAFFGLPLALGLGRHAWHGRTMALPSH